MSQEPASDRSAPSTDLETTVLIPPGPAPGGWQPPTLVLPVPFDRYRLREFLGKGGMGQVWSLAGTEGLPGVPLAIKFLWHPKLVDDPRLFQQFQQEARAGIGISHQFIAHAHEFLNLRDHVAAGWPPAALVMTRYEVSLQQVLEDLRRSGERLPPELVLEFARNLAMALQHLHGRKGLVHRDLKPANVLIGLSDGQAYDRQRVAESLTGASALLADLGVVSRAGMLPPFVLHQDGWKPPELFLSGSQTPMPNRSAACPEDIYAFGLVLRELGRVLQETPTWLMEVVEQCLQTNPEDRPHASMELLLRLSPDWRIQDYMVRGGWKPAAHPNFTGRQFVFAAFERFRQACEQRDRGGIFLLEGDAGVGKTALLNMWAGRERGPHPTFFFRQTEGRIAVPVMLETLFEALCRRYQVNQPLPARPGRYADALEGLVRYIAAEKLGTRDNLLILVDGLDEAGDPLAASQALPKHGLPRGVFLIVSSRPAAGPVDHLASLVAAGAQRFLLRGTDRLNLVDLESYLELTLERHLARGQAAALAEATGGIFLLAVFLVEAISQGTLTVAEALQMGQNWAGLPQANRMFSWYHESWQRITNRLSSFEEQENLEDFLCLMAAAQAPLGEKQVLDVLGWRNARLNWALKMVSWFLDRKTEEANGYREAYLQLRHQSVYDFLVSVDYQGPARYALQDMHVRVAEHYLRKAREQGWANVEPYGRFFTVRHLRLSGRSEQLTRAAECLTDLDFLQATLGEVSAG